MEKIIQRDPDHRFIVKKVSDNKYEVTFQEFTRMNNMWYTISRDLYDKSGLSMLGISMI